MKFQILRRAGVAALALFLALTLSMILSAPGRADPGSEASGSEAGTPTETGVPPETTTSPEPTTPTSPEPTAPTSPEPTAPASPEPTQALRPSLTIDGSASITQDPGKLELTAILYNVPSGAERTVTWSVTFRSAQRKTTLPALSDGTNTVTAPAGADTVTITAGETVTLDSSISGPGEFIVTAAYTQDPTAKDTKYVTISGLVLSSGNKELEEGEDWRHKSMAMLMNESAVLTVDIFGDANDPEDPMVAWESNAPSTVSVPYNGGSLMTWQLGKATIMASACSGKYWVECEVRVVEDKDVIVGPYTASVSKPLILNNVRGGYQVYSDLNNIAENIKKIGELSYITNLSVRTSQGTLYYNYSTESDTGAGVGAADRFAKEARGAVKSLDKLYFVPRAGFTGTAEITFNAVAENGNFAGVIKVDVGTESGGAFEISYRTRAGDPVWFLSDDFSAYCQRHANSGRDFNYIIFNLPKSGEGVLYYNYISTGSGNLVSTSLHFGHTGRYIVDDVCFVPNATYTGDVKIGFRAVDTAGVAVDGTVTVTVTAASVSDPSVVTAVGERGRPVTLSSSLFHDACRGTINDTLTFVTFKLPDPAEGALYVNYRGEGDYDSRVTAGTRCYYSGVPGLDSISFVPASSAAGRIAISYTGHGSSGASYSGTLYVVLEEVDRSVIYYSVAKGGSVTFNASDFYNAGLYRTGFGVNRVVFKDESGNYNFGYDFGGLGSLYYNYRSSNYYNTLVYPGALYYYSTGNSWQNRLGLISFRAGNEVGTVTLDYEAYRSANDVTPSFTGTVVIRVGSPAPEDINLSCDAGGYARLTTWAVDSVCGAVMNGNLSYIEITSVPDPGQGRLYLGYDYRYFDSGTAVTAGDRFYLSGSPSVGQLSFVPFARFAGEAEITYIGHSTDGKEQVSGRIVVNVGNSASSLYFDDMGRYTWAADSVDYLRRNGTVEGVGSRRYAPSNTVKRGDFVLMLVRAYRLTASGSASFNDVPDNHYYADAIRVAARLGIISGAGGSFRPEAALNRQDAMVMIFNTLKATGKTATNGLAADLGAYYDADQISAYAREAMGSLVQMGVIEGDGNGYLRPLRQLNRAEAAILLHTIMTL